MTKTMRRALIAAALFSALIASGYSTLWFWGVHKIKAQIAGFAVTANEKGVTFTGNKPRIYGFPFTYKAAFNGRVLYGPLAVDLPLLEIDGLFLPGHRVTIDLPESAQLSAPDIDKNIWSVDRLSVRLTIPESLPAAFTIEDLRAWRESKNALTIDEFHLQKKQLDVRGSGSLTLDGQLQPAGDFNIRATGHIQFLSWLKEQELLDIKGALLAGSVLAGLSKYDQETGDPYLEGNLSLQSQTVFLGPLRLFSLPALQWPWRSESATPTR